MLADHAADEAMPVAGGTDLYPQHEAASVHAESRRGARERREQPRRLRKRVRRHHHRWDDDAHARRRERAVASADYPAIATAAKLVSAPVLRNMGTIGGNLCVDTRCNYYNQSYEWRKSINFCMKKDGEICWVAPSSPRCWAVSSSDTAPVFIALDAECTLVGPDGERRVPVKSLYQHDGIDFLKKKRDEILTEIHVPKVGGMRATYLKLRRRDSIDFPILGVACRARDRQGRHRRKSAHRAHRRRVRAGPSSTKRRRCSSARSFPKTSSKRRPRSPTSRRGRSTTPTSRTPIARRWRASTSRERSRELMRAEP